MIRFYRNNLKGLWVVIFCLALQNACLAKRVFADNIIDHQIVVSRFAGGNIHFDDVRVAKLSAPPNAGSMFNVTVPIEDKVYMLELRRYSSRAKGYKLLIQGDDGLLKEAEPGPIRCFRGRVVEVEQSRASGSFREDGMEAMIEMNNNVYFIEPWLRYSNNADIDEYIIYKDIDVDKKRFACNVSNNEPNRANTDGNMIFDAVIDDSQMGAFDEKSGFRTLTATLACDSDFEYFSQFGSAQAVEAQIMADINTVNFWYERDADISHEIIVIVVRASQFEDPYMGLDLNTLLDTMEQVWSSSLKKGVIVPQRDIVHLWSGKGVRLQGLANTGTICEDLLNVCLSMRPCATSIAHEIGHVWGLVHCKCSGWIMNSGGDCSEDSFHPLKTIPKLKQLARRHRSCLDK